MSNSEGDHPGIPEPPSRGLARFAGVIVSRERFFDVISTIVTAIFTVVLAISTVLLWKETKDLRNFAQQQGEDMKASIAEAARAATAMNKLADAVAENAKAANESLTVFKDSNVRQWRAYATMGLGGVVPQDKATGYRFEVRMSLNNVGLTPAYKLKTYARLVVLPSPVPDNLQLPIPDLIAIDIPGDTVGPHQQFVVSAVADRILSDDEVNAVSNTLTQRLYVFGRVTYEDNFGIGRTTNFFQAINFMKDKSFMSENMTTGNTSD
jgi:hypothetical protein